MNTQPSTGSQGRSSSCASASIASEAAGTLRLESVGCKNVILSWGIACPRSSVPLTPEPQQTSSSLPRSLPDGPGRTILPVHNVEHIFYILPCPDWPKGYYMGNLLFNLFKTLLFRAPLEIIFLLWHEIEGANNFTVLWDMHSLKAHST